MNIPLNIDWQQILLHLFNFVILAGGLFLLLYGPVKRFMEKRAAYYKEMDEKATATLHKAEQEAAEYQEHLKTVDEEVRQMKAEAVKRAEEVTNEEIARAKAQGEKILEDARKQAQAEQERMVSEAQGEITQMALNAVEKLMGKDSSETLDEFLNSVKEE